MSLLAFKKQDISAWPMDCLVPWAHLTFGTVKASWARIHTVAGGIFWAVVACSTREACSLSGEIVVSPCKTG